jgi:tRNA (guanine37-N1)-methyltransferase
VIFTVLTLFPDQIRNFLLTSIIGRAYENGMISLNAINIRDYAGNTFGKVDDRLYGGGKGMLMMCEPVYQAWNAARTSSPEKPHTVYLSPKGKIFDQKKAIELSQYKHLILLCGHYEGVDQRVIDEIADEDISIGDYVLTGGEAAACIVVDAVSRMIPGVLPDASAYENESHMNGILESAQYTKPESWHEVIVPEVLRQGHHAKINEWRRLEGLYETWRRRPDLLNRLSLTNDDWEYLLNRDKDEVKDNQSNLAGDHNLK